jgi:hypothetical protein
VFTEDFNNPLSEDIDEDKYGFESLLGQRKDSKLK